MKRITTVLKESEAMAVRKAVCVAGADRVVVSPIAQNSRAIDLWQWHGDQAFEKMHVRLEVTADDCHYGGIVSAINRITHVGKIDLASRHDSQLRCAA